MRRAIPWTLLTALAILLLAAGLRFYRLDAQSLWNDEGTSAALALRDLGTIARNASDDIHPPLYYWLLAGWVRLFGDSEFALRSLSALLGLSVVALTMRLAQRWFTSRAMLLALKFCTLRISERGARGMCSAPWLEPVMGGAVSFRPCSTPCRPAVSGRCIRPKPAWLRSPAIPYGTRIKAKGVPASC